MKSSKTKAIKQAGRSGSEISQPSQFPKIKSKKKKRTMMMKGMIANTPSDITFLAACWGLIRLTLNACIHDMVSANCAVVHDHVCKDEGKEGSDITG